MIVRFTYDLCNQCLLSIKFKLDDMYLMQLLFYELQCQSAVLQTGRSLRVFRLLSQLQVTATEKNEICWKWRQTPITPKQNIFIWNATIQMREGRDRNNRLNPATFLCRLIQVWIAITWSHGIFCVRRFEVRGCCSFSWYELNCWSWSLFFS